MDRKHLLLFALLHAGSLLFAQENSVRSITRTVDVQRTNEATSVTIINTENGVTTTQVLTGTEAEAWLEDERTGMGVEDGGENVSCKVVVITDDDAEGDSKADVFRYRYKSKEGRAAAEAGPGQAKAMVFCYRYATKDAADAKDGVDLVEVAPEAGQVKQMELPDDALVFFPNPSNGACTMRYELPGEEEALITIVDPAGREVYSERTPGGGTGTRTIDLTGKGPGEFIARVVQGGVTLLKKLVIE